MTNLSAAAIALNDALSLEPQPFYGDEAALEELIAAGLAARTFDELPGTPTVFQAHAALTTAVPPTPDAPADPVSEPPEEPVVEAPAPDAKNIKAE